MATVQGLTESEVLARRARGEGNNVRLPTSRSYAEPPTAFFVGGDELGGDWRPTILTVGMLLAFIGVLLIGPLRHFF